MIILVAPVCVMLLYLLIPDVSLHEYDTKLATILLCVVVIYYSIKLYRLILIKSKQTLGVTEGSDKLDVALEKSIIWNIIISCVCWSLVACIIYTSVLRYSVISSLDSMARLNEALSVSNVNGTRYIY